MTVNGMKSIPPAIAIESGESGPAGAEGLSVVVERHLRDYFAAHTDGLPASGVYDRIIREVERPLIALSLAATRGNQLRAAELLGLNRNTLRKKIRELDIQLSRSLK
jgi:two-component system nitrogen regulation response regulator GlnG